MGRGRTSDLGAPWVGCPSNLGRARNDGNVLAQRGERFSEHAISDARMQRQIVAVTAEHSAFAAGGNAVGDFALESPTLRRPADGMGSVPEPVLGNNMGGYVMGSWPWERALWLEDPRSFWLRP